SLGRSLPVPTEDVRPPSDDLADLARRHVLIPVVHEAKLDPRDGRTDGPRLVRGPGGVGAKGWRGFAEPVSLADFHPGTLFEALQDDDGQRRRSGEGTAKRRQIVLLEPGRV